MLTAAIVGLGWWGRTIVGALDGNDHLRIVSAVTGSAAGAETARAHGLRTTPDYADVLRDDSIDAVILCTPNSLHLGEVRQAAAAGKHVFCEKPLALTRADAQAAVAACAAAGVVLGVGHERRFEPAIREMRRRAAAGALGTPLQIEANFSQDKFLDLPESNWRLSATEAPGGPMTATGIHLLDLAVSFLGPAERVFASVRQLDSRLVNGDTLAALVQFRSGAHALISAMLATPFASRFALYGSKGWAEAVDRAHPDRPAGATLTICLRGEPPETIAYQAESAVRANLEAFAAAAEGRAPYPITAEEMVSTIAILEACVASMGSGALTAVKT
jgi:predicted dehydrogenase